MKRPFEGEQLRLKKKASLARELKYSNIEKPLCQLFRLILRLKDCRIQYFQEPPLSPSFPAVRVVRFFDHLYGSPIKPQALDKTCR